MYREFRLRLHPDPGSVFADDVEFHNTDGPVDFHPGNVYSGSLDGKFCNIKICLFIYINLTIFNYCR